MIIFKNYEFFVSHLLADHTRYQKGFLDMWDALQEQRELFPLVLIVSYINKLISTILKLEARYT